MCETWLQRDWMAVNNLRLCGSLGLFTTTEEAVASRTELFPLAIIRIIIIYFIKKKKRVWELYWPESKVKRTGRHFASLLGQSLPPFICTDPLCSQPQPWWGCCCCCISGTANCWWNMAQHGHHVASSQKALMLEMKSLQDEPVEGFKITLVNESDMYNWEVAIFGPPNTHYEGGYFKVSG